MRHNFLFTPADALRINKKMMAQKAAANTAATSLSHGDNPEQIATMQARSGSMTFSVKEMNDAMTKARALLAA